MGAAGGICVLVVVALPTFLDETSPDVARPVRRQKISLRETRGEIGGANSGRRRDTKRQKKIIKREQKFQRKASSCAFDYRQREAATAAAGVLLRVINIPNGKRQRWTGRTSGAIQQSGQNGGV